MKENEKVVDMAKATRLAINEAKNVIIEWAERFEDDTDKLGLTVIASNRLMAEMVEAIMAIGDPVTEKATLQQIDATLTPVIAKLRANVSSFKGDSQ